MKKGFTLIELLTVIAILAIILLIAVPYIINTINNVKNNAFVKDEQMMASATKTYLAANLNLVPANIGDTVEIKLSDLQTNNFITTIKDPKNNSITCDGYILVTKTNNNVYNYLPHLKCGAVNTISDSTEDGLLLHYTFDDFQEPTVNLFPYDGSFSSSSGQHIGDPLLANSTSTNMGGGWRCSTHYNDAVCTIEKNGLYTENELVWRHNSVTGWKAGTLSSGWTAEVGKTYTISVWTKLNNGTYGSQTAYAFYGPVGYQYWFTWDKTPSANTNEWIRGTKTITTDATVSGGVYLYGISNAISGVTVEYDGYQVEEKSYSTEFTSSSRSGNITDYSLNSYSAPLALTTTPRWVTNGKNNSGAYQFDGIDDLIMIPNFNLSQNVFTINFWLNPALDGTGVPMFLVPQSHGSDQYLRYDYTNERVSLGIAETGDTNQRGWNSGNGSVPKNQWSNITLVLNNQIVQLYINGELSINQNETLPIGLWSGTWALGQRGTGTYPYKGLIDDLIIYNRALSNDEIKLYYDTNK